MEYLNSGISEEETLQVALQSGIIDINEISMRIEDMKRKEILSNHPYSIWYSETDNLWKTYLPDIENKNGRIFRKRKNKKDLEDLIVKYYISHQQEIYLKDVFTDCAESQKMKAALSMEELDLCKLLEVNDSATNMVHAVANLELVLKDKLEFVSNNLYYPPADAAAK